MVKLVFKIRSTQNASMLHFYGDLVYKFKRIVGKPNFSDQFKKIVKRYTRGIWKVLSMVFYLSNRFTKPIMFGIILKSHLFSMLWHKFHEDIMMQTRKNLL